MSNFAFAPPPTPTLPLVERDGSAISSTLFPIHRIYCVARNYTEHIKEMGGDSEREDPFFFTKPADAAVDASAGPNLTIPYPRATRNLHHEYVCVYCERI